MLRSAAIDLAKTYQNGRDEDETDIGNDEFGINDSVMDFDNMSNEDLAEFVRHAGLGLEDEDETITDDESGSDV